MLITTLLSVMMMAGLFMLLWGGVGFIQDKKFFSSAPKEAIEVTPDYMPERFKGQHVVGYIMVTIAFALWAERLLSERGMEQRTILHSGSSLYAS